MFCVRIIVILKITFSLHSMLFLNFLSSGLQKTLYSKCAIELNGFHFHFIWTSQEGNSFSSHFSCLPPGFRGVYKLKIMGRVWRISVFKFQFTSPGIMGITHLVVVVKAFEKLLVFPMIQNLLSVLKWPETWVIY